MNKLKTYSVLGIVAVVLIIAAITNTAARCSADNSSAEQIRIQNLLTMQADSLNDVYEQKEKSKLDSLETLNKAKADKLHTENLKLQTDLKKEKKKSAELYKKFTETPTLENCTELVENQQIELQKQYVLVDSLNKELFEWVVLYDNENDKVLARDSTISRKNRTISALQYQYSAMEAHVTNIDQKLNHPSVLKRNWLWATRSYRNWLKSR